MKMLLFGALVLLTIIGTSSWALQFFINQSFETIPDIAEAPPHDLTVVLAGGRGRISQAIDFIAKGRSKRLMIIGAGQGITIKDLIPEDQWPVGVSRELIQVENESLSTYENGLKIREVVLSERLREVTVVTSFYHCLRTRLILMRILPRWTVIHMVGVGTENFQSGGFWTHALTSRLAFVEGVKFLYYWIVLPKIL